MTSKPPVIRPGHAASLLYARLQVIMPGARSILLAWPTSKEGLAADSRSVPLGPALAEAYRSAGIEAATLSLPAESERLLTLDELQKTMAETRLTVVGGSGLLDSPNTIVAACAVDAVVVLARRRITRRNDLEVVRLELKSAGATIAGAVLVD